MNYVPKGTTWRVLIVEDNAEFVRQLKEVASSFVDAPDQIEVYEHKKFRDASKQLTHERFDLLILDLKDDADTSIIGEEKPAGLEIFEALRKTRFVPVVFYTALAHLVKQYETSFVRVVEKTETVTKVREEVKRIFSTKIPFLARHIEEVQREYMWDFVSTHWKEFTSPNDQADIAYLLARRLALSLETEARRLARKVTGIGVPMADPAHVHPMEIYVPLPIGEKRFAGDIVRETVDGKSEDWMVLTPSCDFEQKGRLHNVLLARCLPLVGEVEYTNWKLNSSAANTTLLKALISDNREDAQSERFKFLPGTYFLPDSVVDFQRLKTVVPDELNKMKVVASLDSPFAEAVLARFSRYFGRLGTADIDKIVVLARLQETLDKSKAEANRTASIAAAPAGKTTAMPEVGAVTPRPNEISTPPPIVIPVKEESTSVAPASPNAPEIPLAEPPGTSK